MLPCYHSVLRQVANISSSGSYPRSHHHPSNMGKPEALASIVRIQIGICVPETKIICESFQASRINYGRKNDNYL